MANYRVVKIDEATWGLCKVRMRTADGGRRTADGRMAGWPDGRMAGWPDADKINNKNQRKLKKYINKYKNKNNQQVIKKRKRHVEICPETRRLYFDNKNEIINSHAALRLF